MQKLLAAILVGLPCSQLLALDIGVDYLSGQTQVFDLQGDRSEFDLSGLGYSLGFDLSDSGRVRIAWSDRDGQQGDDIPVLNRTVAVDQDASVASVSVGMSWQFENYWLGAGYSTQEDRSQIVGSTEGRRPNRTLSLDIREQNESSTLSLDGGRDWFFDSWAFALSGSLSSTDSEFDRVERIDSLNISQVQTLQQSLDGTDLALTGSISWLHETGGGALLVPAVSLFHRIQLEGVANGSASLRTVSTSSRLAGSNSQSFGFSDPLDSEDESYLDFSASLIAGPWIGTASYSVPLQADVGNSLYLGLGYQF